MNTRQVPKNPSGKWVRMTDEQLAREQQKFDRSVERLVVKEAQRQGRDPVAALDAYRAAKQQR